jgi:cytoskeleton protein RodZ
MTRAPRTRKKKNAATSESAMAAVEAVATGSDAPGLPLPLPESSVSAVEADKDGAPSAVALPDAGETATAHVAAEEPIKADAPLQEPGARSRLEVAFVDDHARIGQRLRAAREARGWARSDVAHRLHVPVSVIADIESERFERLGAPIYVRGYLGKYARIVDMPAVVVARAIDGLSEPVLQASTDVPRGVAAWERYRAAVIGGVITLAVAIPVLTLVASRGIHAPVPQVQSLDESQMQQRAPETTTMTAMTPPEPVPELPPVAAPAVDAASQPQADDVQKSAPLMASMAGIGTPKAAGGHVLEVMFREDSWIEIFEADGRVVEQNLVRAGERRQYESTGALTVKVGNVGGVELRVDGDPVDLAPHARANVARLRLFEAAPAESSP